MQKKALPSLLLLICLTGFPQIGETIYTPALPDLGHGLQATDNQVQFTLAIYLLAFAFGVYFWGRLSDSYGRRPSTLAGLFVYVVGGLACYWSSAVEILLIARLVQGFGASAGSVVTQAILRESIAEANRARVFAQVSAALALSAALGPFMGGWINQLFGYPAIFITLVAIGLLLFGCTYASLPETRDKATLSNIKALAVFKKMLRDKEIWAFTILIGTINGLLFSYFVEAPFLFRTYFAISSGTYGLLCIVIAGGYAIGALLSRRIVNAYSPRKIIFIGCTITFIGTLLFSGVACLTIASQLLACTLLLLTIFIWVFGLGMAIPNCLSLALVNYRQVLGTAGAILGLKYYLLIGLITSGMSYLHNDAITTMPLYFVVLSTLMLLVSRHLYQAEKAGAKT